MELQETKAANSIPSEDILYDHAPRAQQAFSGWEVVLLIIAVLASIGVHGRFIIDGFGEPDAVRAALQSLVWHQTGSPLNSYVIRTSPLYLFVLKLLIDGGIALDRLAPLTNWASVVMGSLAFIPLYLLWRRLTNRRVAALGCVIYAFVPAYWLANLYGMPHLYAFAIFVLSLWLYALAIERDGRGHAAMLVGVAVTAVTALLLKADIVLCFGAFLGVAWFTRRLTWRNVTGVVAITLVGMIAVIVSARLILPAMERATDFAVNWRDQWPLTLQALRKPNSLVPMYAVGPILYKAMLVSAIFGLLSLRNRRIVALVLVWTLPAILMWSFRYGNSARHLMAAWAAAPFLLASVIDRRYPRRWLHGLSVLQIAALLTWNYVSTNATDSTILPGTRLVQCRTLVQRRIDRDREAGETFATMEPPKRLYFGKTKRSYVQWEVWARAQDFTIVQSGELSDPIVSYVRNASSVMDTIMTVYIGRSEYTIDAADNWHIWTNEDYLTPFLKVRDLDEPADSVFTIEPAPIRE